MFQGASKLSLDGRGRMVVPSRHRDALHVQCDGRLTLTRHPDGCLLMVPRPEWEKKRAEIAQWPMSLKRWQRMFLGNAVDVEMDNAGRVLISPELRDAAGIQSESKVMLLGMGSHFEIWEAAAHEQNEASTAAAGMPDDLRHFSF